MIYTWNVYYDNEYLGQVQGMSEDDACNRAYMAWGSASRYSGRSFEKFTVKRI
jgi:hypothetical protein